VADLVAWDLGKEWEVRGLASLSRNTPLLGKVLKAKPERIWVDGKDGKDGKDGNEKEF